MDAPPTKTTYLSLGAFYLADPRRTHSRETDLGLWWRGTGPNGPTYRAAWVEATGEVYVMQHAGTAGGGRVDVLARHPSLPDVLAALDGWEGVVGDDDSIVWLLERLRRPARAAPDDPPALAVAA